VPDFYPSTLALVVYAIKEGKHGRVRSLYGGSDPITVRRDTARSIVVTTPRSFLSSPGNRLFRGFSYPMRAGEGIQLDGMLVVVNRVDAEGAPVEVTFQFDGPLESERLLWKQWDGAAFRPFSVPGIGSTVLVPPTGGTG
jgi:hypothetical protein